MKTANTVRAAVAARFLRGDLYDGDAILAVLDDSGKLTEYRANYDGRYTLTKLDDGTSYSLPRDLSACSCPDRTYRPLREGGCRHMSALRQALAAQEGPP